MKFRRYLISGFVTLIPLGITWWILDVLFRQLSGLGQPLVAWIYRGLSDQNLLYQFLERYPWLDEVVGALLVILMVWLLGWVTSVWLGRKFMQLFESLLERIPLIKTIYGSVKQLMTVMDRKLDSVQRVVLVEFPQKNMKTVGLVTRTLVDSNSGRELVAVYIPTTPNPTSGYLEIIPLDQVVSTDWTMDEALNFVISGGAVSPEEIPWSAAPTEFSYGEGSEPEG